MEIRWHDLEMETSSTFYERFVTAEGVKAAVINHVSSMEMYRMQDELRNSNGKAALIIHPFYPELHTEGVNEDFNPVSDAKAYEQYLAGLQEATRKYQEENIPILLFLGESMVHSDQSREVLTTIISRLGITKGNVFILPTYDDDPFPHIGIPVDFGEDAMRAALEFFQNKGLYEIVVSGSNLLLDPRPVGRRNPNYPASLQGYRLEGCVGDVIVQGLGACLDVSVEDTATYPRRYPMTTSSEVC